MVSGQWLVAKGGFAWLGERYTLSGRGRVGEPSCEGDGLRA